MSRRPGDELQSEATYFHEDLWDQKEEGKKEPTAQGTESTDPSHVAVDGQDPMKISEFRNYFTLAGEEGRTTFELEEEPVRLELNEKEFSNDKRNTFIEEENSEAYHVQSLDSEDGGILGEVREIDVEIENIPEEVNSPGSSVRTDSSDDDDYDDYDGGRVPLQTRISRCKSIMLR